MGANFMLAIRDTRLFLGTASFMSSTMGANFMLAIRDTRLFLGPAIACISGGPWPKLFWRLNFLWGRALALAAMAAAFSASFLASIFLLPFLSGVAVSSITFILSSSSALFNSLIAF